MPKFIEDRLKKTAARKGLKGRAAARYVYGTMNNAGYMHGNKETAKGREAEAKHARHTAAAKSLSKRGPSPV